MFELVCYYIRSIICNSIFVLEVNALHCKFLKKCFVGILMVRRRQVCFTAKECYKSGNRLYWYNRQIRK